MKLAMMVLAASLLTGLTHARAAEALPRYEYLTVHFDGRENTQIMRPNGEVEFLGPELRKTSMPKDADEKAFYLNLVLNGLIKEGYEFVQRSGDDIIMRRTPK